MSGSRLVGLSAAVFAAVATASAAPTLGGLHGTVKRGPITPVCRVGVPCDAPAAHIVLVFSDARVVSTTRTDASGGYRIKLPAGTYVVHTNVRPFGRTPRPATVRVRAGHSDEIDFTIDTGIR
jgi:hypothetical protein